MNHGVKEAKQQNVNFWKVTDFMCWALSEITLE